MPLQIPSRRAPNSQLTIGPASSALTPPRRDSASSTIAVDLVFDGQHQKYRRQRALLDVRRRADGECVADAAAQLGDARAGRVDGRLRVQQVREREDRELVAPGVERGQRRFGPAAAIGEDLHREGAPGVIVEASPRRARARQQRLEVRASRARLAGSIA